VVKPFHHFHLPRQTDHANPLLRAAAVCPNILVSNGFPFGLTCALRPSSYCEAIPHMMMSIAQSSNFPAILGHLLIIFCPMKELHVGAAHDKQLHSHEPQLDVHVYPFGYSDDHSQLIPMCVHRLPILHHFHLPMQTKCAT